MCRCPGVGFAGWDYWDPVLSLLTLSHQSLCRGWGQGGGGGTFSFVCCSQFCASKVGLDMAGSGSEPQFEVKFRILVSPLPVVLPAEVSQVSLRVGPFAFLSLLEDVTLAVRHQ